MRLLWSAVNEDALSPDPTLLNCQPKLLRERSRQEGKGATVSFDIVEMLRLDARRHVTEHADIEDCTRNIVSASLVAEDDKRTVFSHSLLFDMIASPLLHMKHVVGGRNTQRHELSSIISGSLQACSRSSVRQQPQASQGDGMHVVCNPFVRPL